MALSMIYPCFAVLLLTSDFLVVNVGGQSEWVWGKSAGSGSGSGKPLGQNSGTSIGNSGFLNPTNYYYNTNGNPNNNINNNNNNFIGSGSNNNGLVPVNTVTIFGSGGGTVQNSGGSASASGDKFFTSHSQTSIPVSANQPIIVQVLQPGSTSTGSGSDSKNNDVIPSNSIRSGVIPANGEPRLFLSGIRNRLHKALKSLVNNNGGGGLGGLGGGGGGLGNLNSIIQSSSGGGSGLNGLGGLSGLSGLSGGGGGGGGGGILNTLQQIGPLLSQGLGGRLPTVGPLPVSNSEFNTQGTSGSGSSSSSGPSSSGNGISFINSGQSCSCVSSDSCRLPNVDKGTCSGGIMCCRATGTRIVSDNNSNNKDSSNSDNTRSPSSRFRVSDLRSGLLAEIVRGTGTVFDDALDLLLAPFLNQDDQQRLANRIASGTRKGSNK